jgi:thiamine-monophosphate kinase
VLPDELSIIDRYFRPLAGEGAFALRDDAAVLSLPPEQELVVTTDMIARGVHFLDDPADTIAQKALRVNLSDLAGKGATPIGYVLSLALSPEIDATWLDGFADGLRKDQRRFGIKLLGGDTIVTPDRLVISLTAFGSVPKGRMVRRSGGRPGDQLYISGMVGGSTAGLALLKGESGPWSEAADWQRDILLTRYRVPEPRVALAPALRDFASAAMDVSDGLVGDCDKLAAASGCSAIIEAEKVPLPPGLAGAGDTALVARFLTAGEDFEILAAIRPENAVAFAAKARERGVPVARIGALVEGTGLTNVLFEGRPLGLSERAYVHGRVETAK